MSHTSLAFLFMVRCSVPHPSCSSLSTRLPGSLGICVSHLSGQRYTGCVSSLRSFVNVTGFIFDLGLQ